MQSSPHISSPSNLLNIQRGLVCKRSWKEVFGEYSFFDNYLLSILMIFCLIPLVLIAILYITIYIKLKLQKIPGEQSGNAGQQRQQMERNVLKTTIAILLGFVVCGVRFSIRWFFLIFASDLSSCGFQYFAFFVAFMVRVSCAINPCICLIFSRNYRIGLKTLFS